MNLSRYQYITTLVLLLAATALLRIPSLSLPLSGDEAFSLIKYASDSALVTISTYIEPNNHIFHNLLVHYFTYIFGDSPEYKVRCVSFIFGLSTIVVFFNLMGRMFGFFTAAVATGLFILNPMAFKYGILARGYGILPFFCICSFYASEKARLQRERHEKPGTGWEACSIVSNTLGMWTVPTYLIYIVFEIVYSLLLLQSADLKDSQALNSRKKGAASLNMGGFQITRLTNHPLTGMAIKYVMTGLFTILCYMPVLLQSDGIGNLLQNRFVAPMSPSRLIYDFPLFPIRLFSAFTGSNPILTIIFISLSAAALIISWFRKERVILYLAVSMITASLLVIIAKRAFPPPRAFIVFVPFFCLTMAYAITRATSLAADTRRLQKCTGLFFILFIAAFMSYPYFKGEILSKTMLQTIDPDVKELSRIVRQKVIDEQAIIGTDCCFNYTIYYYISEDISIGKYLTYFPDDRAERVFILKGDHYGMDTLLFRLINDIHDHGVKDTSIFKKASIRFKEKILNKYELYELRLTND